MSENGKLRTNHKLSLIQCIELNLKRKYLLLLYNPNLLFNIIVLHTAGGAVRMIQLAT